jgi:uncharacterized protein YndB with AHSA1/START domain
MRLGSRELRETMRITHTQFTHPPSMNERSRQMDNVKESAETPAHEVTVERTIEAPRERVWAAWTQPAHFSQWFGVAPFATPQDRISLDVRPGGRWSATQVSAQDGTELPFVGTYGEVVEPERLVMIFENPQDPSDPNTEIATITLGERDGGTEMVLHQVGHLPPEAYGDLERGYSMFFEQLAHHVEQG